MIGENFVFDQQFGLLDNGICVICIWVCFIGILCEILVVYDFVVINNVCIVLE